MCFLSDTERNLFKQQGNQTEQLASLALQNWLMIMKGNRFRSFALSAYIDEGALTICPARPGGYRYGQRWFEFSPSVDMKHPILWPPGFPKRLGMAQMLSQGSPPAGKTYYQFQKHFIFSPWQMMLFNLLPNGYLTLEMILHFSPPVIQSFRYLLSASCVPKPQSQCQKTDVCLPHRGHSPQRRQRLNMQLQV